MRLYSNFHTNLSMLIKGKSPILQDINFLHMFLHKAIQIEILKPICNEFPTNPLLCPLDILGKMKRDITASFVSDKILLN